jgi:hypothetical protein
MALAKPGTRIDIDLRNAFGKAKELGGNYAHLAFAFRKACLQADCLTLGAY